MKAKRYYSLVKSKKNKEANLDIFGDIVSYPYMDSDISNFNLSKQLQALGDVQTINVHINSYGGEVAEGLAIYNALKNHKAKIKTFCDGFACSIASVIFMAGDERIMSKASALMIHNAWTFVSGNSAMLRKQADDLDKITQASVNAYMEHVSISETELKKLLDQETWVGYEEALAKGFATGTTSDESSSKASQSAKKMMVNMILSSQTAKNEEGGDNMIKYECSECGYIYDGELPEYFVCPECGADKEAFIELDDEETETDAEAEDKEKPSNDETATNDNESDEEGETEINKNEEDEKDKTKDEEKVTKEQTVAFFNAIIGGMK